MRRVYQAGPTLASAADDAIGHRRRRCHRGSAGILDHQTMFRVPVVIIHGLAQGARDWADVAARLDSSSDLTSSDIHTVVTSRSSSRRAGGDRSC